MKQPDPKAEILARRAELVAGLRTILPERAVIEDKISLKPYETDGLAAYRQTPLAVVLPETEAEVATVHEILCGAWRAGDPARRRHVVVRRRAAARRCGGRGHDAHEPHSRNQLRRPLRRGAARRDQYRHHQRGRR